MAELAPHEEKKQIKDLVNNTKLKEGQEWFVVDFKWWQLWKAYVGYEDTTGSNGGDGPRPGPITNTDLLDAAEVAGTESNRLRPGLVEEYDYVVIPKEAWIKLESWYGGGPKVMRRVVTVGMAQKCRVDLYPIELAWGKSGSGGIFSPGGRVLVSRQATFKELKRKIAGIAASPPHKTRLWIKDDDGDWECLDSPLLEAKGMDEMGFEDGHVVMLELMTGDEWPRDKLRHLNRAGTSSSTSVEMTELRNKGANRVADMESDYTGIGPRLPAGYSSAGTAANPANRTAMSSYSYRDRYSNTEGKVNPGLAGLNNLGNTCFMNSALQCLSNTVQLTNYFLSNEYLGDVNATNPLGMKGLLAKHYGMMLKQVWSGKYKVVSPTRFKQVVGKFAPQFSGFSQQDSQELVAFLLDGLHEDLNKVLQKPYVEAVEAKGRPDEVVAEEAWEGHLKRNKSVIVDLFQGQFKSTVNCDVCDKMSVTFDPFMYLSVPLPVTNDRVMLITTVYLTKPPLIHAIKVPKLGDVSDIQKQLSKISGLTPEQMGICDVYAHKVFAALAPKKAIKDIRESDDIYCFEITPQPSVQAQEKHEDKQVKEAEAGQVNEDSMETDDAPAVPGQQVAANANAGQDKGKDKQVEVAKPPLEYIPVINRERKLTGTLSKTLTWNAIGFPFVLSFNPATTTHRQLYEMVMNLVKKVFNKEDVVEEEVKMEETTPQPEAEKMDEEGKAPAAANDANANAPQKEEEGKGRGGFPFALSFGSGYSGTSNHQVPVDDQLLGALPKISGVVKPSLICDWSAEGLKKYYDEKVVGKHSSVAEISADQQKSIPLESCINLFTQQEKLSATDTWYCSKCQEHREALKKFDVWKLPQILVVHLKRFQFSRTWREKIETLVEFPVEGLDLTHYVKGPDSDKPQIYDLYGVSNHSGGMGFGHYTAYAKNHRENKWFKFNDSFVSDASEKDVVSKEAYMLFYERRADTTIKPVDFEYDDAEITETIAQIKKDKSLDDIDEDDGYTSSKNKAGASSSSSSGYYTSTSSSAGNSGVAGKELVLVGSHSDAMAVDQRPGPAAPDYYDDDDEAEEGQGLLRNLRRAGAPPVAGVSPGFVDPNSIPSVLNPNPGVIPSANANPNVHPNQPPL